MQSGCNTRNARSGMIRSTGPAYMISALTIFAFLVGCRSLPTESDDVKSPDMFCRFLESKIPPMPEMFARRNFTEKRNLFAVTGTDGQSTIVWGLGEINKDNYKGELANSVRKYGTIEYRSSDTCPRLGRLYEKSLSIYNKEIERLLVIEESRRRGQIP